MKVLLLSSYGSYIPKFIRDHMQANSHSWRWGSVIDYIESNAVVNQVNCGNLLDQYNIIEFSIPNSKEKKYLIKRDGNKIINIFVSIIEVDVSRPWTILEYDGSEYIQYLDHTCIDKKANYCILPKD